MLLARWSCPSSRSPARLWPRGPTLEGVLGSGGQTPPEGDLEKGNTSEGQEDGSPVGSAVRGLGRDQALLLVIRTWLHAEGCPYRETAQPRSVSG